MLPPKMLPWLAKQAGVPKARARQIWRQVVRDADQRFHETAPSPVYWRFVSEQLPRRIQGEGTRHRQGRHSAAARAGMWMPVRCFIPYPLLMASATMLAWTGVARAASRFWHRGGCPSR